MLEELFVQDRWLLIYNIGVLLVWLMWCWYCEVQFMGLVEYVCEKNWDLRFCLRFFDVRVVEKYIIENGCITVVEPLHELGVLILWFC